MLKLLMILVSFQGIGSNYIDTSLRFEPSKVQDFVDAEEITEALPIRFASYYGDHMVLQQSPQKPVVWGFVQNSYNMKTPIHVTLQKHGHHGVESYEATIQESENGEITWQAVLDAHPAGGPYILLVSVNGRSLQLNDVLFGDVWLCSGQSNMEFQVVKMFKAAAEEKIASSFFYVRMMSVKKTESKTPQTDLAAIDLHWAVASNSSLAGSTYFSAVCWVYGRILNKQLGYPIGLISSAYGGTPVEAWSSPRALQRCNVASDQKYYSYDEATGERMVDGPSAASVLWNVMIYPLTKMPIFGAVWYQGEANSGSDNYNCTFPAMIQDWRETFHEKTNTTDTVFPFGFVQLGPMDKSSPNSTGFAVIRRHQTADYGFVPNPILPKVFMGTAVDLTDHLSPYGSVHYRDKTTAGERLALSGLDLAYNIHSYHQGPYPTSMSHNGDNTFTIEYDNGRTLIETRNQTGFEICCPVNGTCNLEAVDNNWHSVDIKTHSNTSVSLDTSQCTYPIHAVRYLFRTSPCEYKKCAVYSVENELPALPFLVSA